ncbi:MAG: hypothetical protein AAFR88_10920 [Pseudomonadota bacterium]
MDSPGGFPILSIMLLVPLVGAIICLFVDAAIARWTALGATLVTLGLGISLWVHWNFGGEQWQYTERAELFDGFARFYV